MSFFKKLENTIGMGPIEQSDNVDLVGEFWPHLGGSSIGFKFGRFRSRLYSDIFNPDWKRGILVFTYFNGPIWVFIQLSDEDIDRGISELQEIHDSATPGKWVIQRTKDKKWLPAISNEIKFKKFIGPPGPTQALR